MKPPIGLEVRRLRSSRPTKLRCKRRTTPYCASALDSRRRWPCVASPKYAARISATRQARITRPARFDSCARVRGSVAGRRNVDHPEIDPDEIAGRKPDVFGQVNGHEQEPLAVIAPNEIALVPWRR